MAEEIIKANPQLPAAPDFMGDAPKGTEQLAQYVTPDRFKILQKSAKNPELMQRYGSGFCIIVKGDGSSEQVAAMEYDNKGNPSKAEPFIFTPLFFFSEYIHWAPDGSEQLILGRSLDPTSEIGMKARSMQYRDRKSETYCEHLCFVSRIEGFAEPVIIGFSRGTHKDGRLLCNLLKSRKAPIYGCRIQASVAKRFDDQGHDWWSLDFVNPEQPWITDGDEFNRNLAEHKDFQEAHAAAILRPSYDEEESYEETPTEF